MPPRYPQQQMPSPSAPAFQQQQQVVIQRYQSPQHAARQQPVGAPQLPAAAKLPPGYNSAAHPRPARQQYSAAQQPAAYDSAIDAPPKAAFNKGLRDLRERFLPLARM